MIVMRSIEQHYNQGNWQSLAMHGCTEKKIGRHVEVRAQTDGSATSIDQLICTLQA
jgi:hypothetical protein